MHYKTSTLQVYYQYCIRVVNGGMNAREACSCTVAMVSLAVDRGCKQKNQDL
jgi:hypothetical protein